MPAPNLVTITGKIRYARALKGSWGKLDVEVDLGEGKRVRRQVMSDGVTSFEPLIGLAVEVQGVEHEHVEYGSQIKAKSVVVLQPRSREELHAWCFARAIFMRPSERQTVLDVFDLENAGADRYFERFLAFVHERNPVAYERARDYVDIDFTRLAELKAACIKLGMPEWVADKALSKWKQQTLEVLEADPYKLMELDGVGFKRADPVARDAFKVELHDPRRVRALCALVIREFESEGHTYTVVNAFRARLNEELPRAVVDQAMSQAELGDNPYIEIFDGRVQSRDTTFDETNLAHDVIVKTRPLPVPSGSYFTTSGHVFVRDEDTCALCGVDGFDGVVDEITRPCEPTAYDGMTLSAEQTEAIRVALKGYSMFVTGFPGSGKTTVIKRLIETLNRQRPREILLCAPTGKAARRMVETIGVEAKTVHRALGGLAWWRLSSPGGVDINGVDLREFQLTAAVVIVDEASMLDTALAERVLHACRGRTQVILVGDAHQLPSVGPGAVLRDLIADGTWPHVHLSQVFRQAEGSWVLRNAPLIARGQSPDLGHTEDFQFITAEDPAEARRIATELMANDLCNGVDVQMLAPQRTKEVGILALNGWTKNLVNPRTDDWQIADGVDVGRNDIVIQTSNNYDLNIFNGETGQIRYLDKNKMVVHFDDPSSDDGRPVTIGRLAARDLQLAYALTVHKSQGSEWEHIIFICHPQHGFMLDRNLIYTAITRAKKKLTIVGTRAALVRGLGKIRQRNTLLRERIVACAVDPELRDG